jgi:pimeloyl-ACP methyl ester carboxylesterase
MNYLGQDCLLNDHSSWLTSVLAIPSATEAIPQIEVPTLAVHGRRDRFFPVGNGEAIAREIPGARLLVLEEAATAIPDAAVGEVTEAMLTLG